MKEIDPKVDRPFIASFLAMDMQGEHWLLPAGVVLAREKNEARELAVARWPNCTLPTPVPWEEVSPQDRLMALEADRQIWLDSLFRVR